MKPGVCSVGTSDPWNAAGLGLDIRTLAELGVPAFTVAAGVSAQDARGLHAALPIDAAMIAAQFAALADAPIGALRIGALLDEASVDAVAEAIVHFDVPVVYDPVLGPSAGGRFVDDAMRAAIRERLLPRVTIVTPNCGEAAYFSGIETDDIAGVHAAARALHELGAGAVLVKGFVADDRVLDVVAWNGTTQEFWAPRVDAPLRGTGCLLAAAAAAQLAGGAEMLAALGFARAFVARKLAGGRS